MLTDHVHRNKWVLNSTDTPLFFLFTQLVIAVVLFLIAHMSGFLQLPLQLDMEVCKGLVPMVGLNVVGLRYVHALRSSNIFAIHRDRPTASATIP